MSVLFDGINHPTAQQVINAGCVGALMYGGTPGDSLGKDFTAAQYADYKAHGLVTAFVFENFANDMASGFSGGAAHARALLADLIGKGVRNTEPVGATVDEHVVAANIPLAVAYQNGFWSAVKSSGWAGPVGGYGFSEFLIAIHNAGIADWYWGAGQRSLLPPYTNIWQDNTGVINVGGSADDRDWILIPLSGGDMNLTDPLPDAKTVAGTGTVQEALTTVLYGIGGQRFGGALANAVASMQAQLTAIQGALTQEEADLLAAFKGVSASAVDVKTLAAALAPILAPLLPAGATPAQFIAALGAQLATPPAGGTP